MQEVRCTKCGKLLYKIFQDSFEFKQGTKNVSVNYSDNGCVIECKCPHRIKQDGKNVPCNTINRIEI